MEDEEEQQRFHLESRPLVAGRYQNVVKIRHKIWISCLLLLLLVFSSVAIFWLNRDVAAVDEEHTKNSNGFHFRAGNLPNALFQFKGIYHLFYQANLSWAHATSVDLVHWRNLPIVLHPDSWYDSNGTMGGSVTLVITTTNVTLPVILYTGISSNGSLTTNAAIPVDPGDPVLQKWRKIGENPVIFGGGSSPTTAWRGGDGRWRTLLAASSAAKTFATVGGDFFKSWSALAAPPFASGGGDAWESLDFFQVSPDLHALKVTIGGRDFYSLGSYVGSRDEFVVGAGGMQLLGPGFRASKSFYDDPRRRRVILAEFHGFLTLPRKIWLDPARNELMQWPIQEFDQLRISKGGTHFRNLKLSSGAARLVYRGNGAVNHGNGTVNQQIDVQVSFRAPDLSFQMGMENMDVNSTSGDASLLCTEKSASGILGPFGLFMEDDHLHGKTAIFFHMGRSRQGLVALVCIDQSSTLARSTSLNMTSLSLNSTRTCQGAYVRLDEHEDLKLRVLMDGTLVETFAQDGRLTVTTLFEFPSRRNIFVFNNGTTGVDIQTLDLWIIRST